MSFTKDFDSTHKLNYGKLSIRIIYDFSEVDKITEAKNDLAAVKIAIETAVVQYLDELTHKGETYLLGNSPVLYAKAYMGTRVTRFAFTPLTLVEVESKAMHPSLHFPPGVRGGYPNQYLNNQFAPRPGNNWMSGVGSMPPPLGVGSMPPPLGVDPFNSHTGN